MFAKNLLSLKKAISLPVRVPLSIAAVTLMMASVVTQAEAIKLGVIGDSVSAEFYLDGYDDGLISSEIGAGFDMSIFAGSDACGDGGLGGILDLFMGMVPMYTDFPARSWLQILKQQRASDFNFGAYTDDPDLYGEPRLRGNEYNFARVGGTIVAPGLSQTPMATQIQQVLPYAEAGALDVVFVNIGSNDFAARELKGESFCDQSWYDFQAQLIDQLFDGVDKLSAAGIDKIIIGELPLGTATSTTDTNGLIISRIQETNVLIHQLAALRSIPVIDAYAFNYDASRSDGQGNITMGGHLIAAGSAASMDDALPAGPAYDGAGELGACASKGKCGTLKTTLNFFATDGLHPNTPVQGLIANEIINALNTHYGYNVAPLTDAEILAAGGTFVADSWLQIRQNGNNDCLTIKSNNYHLTVSDCSVSNNKQQWQVLSKGGRYQIKAVNNVAGFANGSCIADDGSKYFVMAECADVPSQMMDIYDGAEDRDWFVKPDSRNTCLYQHKWYGSGKAYGGNANCGLYYGWKYMRWGFVLQGKGAPLKPSTVMQ